MSTFLGYPERLRSKGVYHLRLEKRGAETAADRLPESGPATFHLQPLKTTVVGRKFEDFIQRLVIKHLVKAMTRWDCVPSHRCLSVNQTPLPEQFQIVKMLCILL